MEASYVTSKGQLVVPVKLRRKYGIKSGTKVCFIEHDHEIIFQPVTRDYIRSVRGMLKGGPSLTKALLKERMLDKRREETKFEKLGSR